MLTSGQTSADIKVEPRSTFKSRLRVAFHLLSLFHLRKYILRAFAVEINPQWNSVKRLKIRNLQIFNCLKAKENIAPKSRKHYSTVVWLGQVQTPHHTNVCKISRLYGAVSLLSLNVSSLNLVSNIILTPLSGSVEGYSLIASYQQLKEPCKAILTYFCTALSVQCCIIINMHTSSTHSIRSGQTANYST